MTTFENPNYIAQTKAGTFLKDATELPPQMQAWLRSKLAYI
jgi:hypothetical protein